MLDGGSLGKFEFEVSDFFLFGSPLGLVLALRKTVIPMLDGKLLHTEKCNICYSVINDKDNGKHTFKTILYCKYINCIDIINT